MRDQRLLEMRDTEYASSQTEWSSPRSTQLRAQVSGITQNIRERLVIIDPSGLLCSAPINARVYNPVGTGLPHGTFRLPRLGATEFVKGLQEHNWVLIGADECDESLREDLAKYGICEEKDLVPFDTLNAQLADADPKTIALSTYRSGLRVPDTIRDLKFDPWNPGVSLGIHVWKENRGVLDIATRLRNVTCPAENESRIGFNRGPMAVCE